MSLSSFVDEVMLVYICLGGVALASGAGYPVTFQVMSCTAEKIRIRIRIQRFLASSVFFDVGFDAHSLGECVAI